MSSSEPVIYPSTEWTANDYSNIITIGAAAVSSVLLVFFKSRCRTINLCCGLIGCMREPATPQPQQGEEPEAAGASLRVGWDLEKSRRRRVDPANTPSGERCTSFGSGVLAP